MERRREADHLVTAGRELGHADRRLVGLAAGVQQQHLLQLRRQQRGKLAAQLDHLRRQDPAEQMQRALAAARDRGDDVRMVVAERRAHLAGGEVEDAPAAVVVDVRALRPFDEERREVADVADHVVLDGILQLPPPFLPACAAAAASLMGVVSPASRHARRAAGRQRAVPAVSASRRLRIRLHRASDPPGAHELRGELTLGPFRPSVR